MSEADAQITRSSSDPATPLPPALVHKITETLHSRREVKAANGTCQVK